MHAVSAHRFFLILTITSLTTSGIAHASTPSDLADLVGARGSSGEDALRSRGYVLTDHAQGDDEIWTYWWNGGREKCVGVRTADGRYQSIRDAARSDCNQPARKSNDGATIAAAVGVAAVIGALALSHKSNHHDDYGHSDNADHESEYERGYRDGLYNHAYHNYSRSDSYSSGYQSGTRQRDHDTAYRPGYSGNGYGYNQYVDVYYLRGMSRTEAESELLRIGFQQQQTYRTDGDGRFTTYWRAGSKQCINVNTRDGYVFAVNSQNKRNCS